MGTSPPVFRLPNENPMLTIEGAALIVEVVATAWLVVALIGFGVRRTMPWLLCAAVAFAMLMTTVVVVIDVSST
jgi:hypothetical protein